MGEYPKDDIISETEYLVMEESAEYKSEYYAGSVHAMAGGTTAHAAITGNIYVALRSALAGRPCQVYVLDVKVKIASERSFVYPDVMVQCGEGGSPSDSTFCENPSLVVEVLSGSTAAFDLGPKRRMYQSLPSLQHYLVVDQKRPILELWTRRDGGSWENTGLQGFNEVLRLEHLGVEIAVADVYAGIGISPWKA